MTGDRRLADFRRWTLTVLGLLSAPPDRQTAYVREAGVGTDELLLQFDDVLHTARARAADGSLRQEDLLLLLEVDERVDAVNAGPDSIWDEAALGTSTEWRELRVTAGVVKAAFEKSWSLDSGDQSGPPAEGPL